MTTVKRTPAELRLLDIHKARGIPYPDDICAWREGNAAAIAALEVRAEPAVRAILGDSNPSARRPAECIPGRDRAGRSGAAVGVPLTRDVVPSSRRPAVRGISNGGKRRPPGRWPPGMGRTALDPCSASGSQ